jgi:hypothetical protein
MLNLCNMNQKNAQFFTKDLILIIVSATCFEHPSVLPQEDLYVQFYGIFSCIQISSPVDITNV